MESHSFLEMMAALFLSRGPNLLLIVLAVTIASYATPQENGRLFDAPGATIYYEVIGSGTGTPLIVINGGPGFDHTYLHISTAWKSLARNRPIIFYDQRGNGRSSAVKPGQSCTLNDQISDLEALRAHLRFDKMDLLGHSWGGFLGMAYAAQFPERVAHLVLLDSVPPRWNDNQSVYEQVFPDNTERRVALDAAAKQGDKAASVDSLRSYLSMLFYSPEKREAFLDKFSPAAVNPEVMGTVLRDVVRFDLNPEVHKFAFPTLVANGRFDTDVTPVVAFKLHQAIPQSSLVIFEKSGHFPFYEEPDEFVHTIQAFLAPK